MASNQELTTLADVIRVPRLDVSGLAFSPHCSPCPAGSFSAAGATQCFGCQAGSFSKHGAASCVLCGVNEYSGGCSHKNSNIKILQYFIVTKTEF